MLNIYFQLVFNETFLIFILYLIWANMYFIPSNIFVLVLVEVLYSNFDIIDWLIDWLIDCMTIC